MKKLPLLIATGSAVAGAGTLKSAAVVAAISIICRVHIVAPGSNAPTVPGAAMATVLR